MLPSTMLNIFPLGAVAIGCLVLYLQLIGVIDVMHCGYEAE